MPKQAYSSSLLHVTAAVNTATFREVRNGKFPLFVSAKWIILRSFARGFCQKIALLPIGGETIEALSHVSHKNLATQKNQKIKLW